MKAVILAQGTGIRFGEALRLKSMIDIDDDALAKKCCRLLEKTGVEADIYLAIHYRQMMRMSVRPMYSSANGPA